MLTAAAALRLAVWLLQVDVGHGLAQGLLQDAAALGVQARAGGLVPGLLAEGPPLRRVEQLQVVGPVVLAALACAVANTDAYRSL